MFVCKACLRKSLGAVASDARLLRPAQTQAAKAFGPRRLASTSAAAAPQSSPSPEDRKTELAEERRVQKVEFAVKKHLQYLSKDPFKVQEHVLRILEKGNFEEAVTLVRKASRDTKLTVSWNHLIDYEMKNQHLHAAIKLYNEMKKRAQLPDAKTFTIIFRGCAKSNHPKLAVSEALRIYNSMIVNERISPNTYHLNGVLEVCNHAGDLDSMFTVLETINNGNRKPDCWTYTIVLNALRNSPNKLGHLDLDPAAAKQQTDLVLNRAKMLWEDVMARWNNGQILIDEALVCAMGRILAMGDYADKKSILGLLESTMRIPRFDLTEGAAVTGDTQAQLQPKAARSHSLTVSKPGNNTLSLVMTCLQMTKKTSVAHKYWQHFTSVYGVKPDKANYVSYIQVLMKGRASAKVAEAVCSVPNDSLVPFVYRNGFSTCIHDGLNKHAFEHACKIFDFMIEKAPYPDPLSMRLFLQVARSNVRHLYEKHKDDPNAGKLAVGSQVVTALERMWNPFRLLMNTLHHTGRDQPKKKLWGLRDNEKEEAVATARRMIAAMDVVTGDQMSEDEKVLETLKARRSLLNKLVERYVERLPVDVRSKGNKKMTLREDGRTDPHFPRIA
jgi:pentatricopeptide repeat protein